MVSTLPFVSLLAYDLLDRVEYVLALRRGLATIREFGEGRGATELRHQTYYD